MDGTEEHVYVIDAKTLERKKPDKYDDYVRCCLHVISSGCLHRGANASARDVMCTTCKIPVARANRNKSLQLWDCFFRVAFFLEFGEIVRNVATVRSWFLATGMYEVPESLYPPAVSLLRRGRVTAKNFRTTDRIPLQLDRRLHLRQQQWEHLKNNV